MANSYRPAPRGPRSARRRAVYRRRRFGVLAGLLSAAVIVYLLVPGGGSTSSGRGKAKPAHGVADAPQPPPAVEAGLLPWSLSSALSREVVLPGGGSNLLVAGGLNAAQKSLGTVLSIDVTTGNKTIEGSLAAGVHDSAAAVIGGQVQLFGGGSPKTVGTVQQFGAPPGTGTPTAPPASWLPPSSATGSGATTAVPGTAPVVITGASTTSSSASPITGTASGNLPRPRSDQSAVTVRSTTYVVGGYNGTGPDPEIWATTDGTHFSVAGRLAVPVRYAAVTAAGGKIYLFGGEAVGGTQDGAAVASVQVFDPTTGRVVVAGSLAQAVAGASAFELDGHIYIAGGVSDAAPATAGGPAKLSDSATTAIWAWDQTGNRALAAGNLPAPIAYAGSAVTYGRGWLVGGENNAQPQATVEAVWPNPAFGTAGAAGAGSPYYGDKLLIADRGNNRLLLLSPGDQIGWTYPSASAAAPPGGFYFPDDAFFSKNGSEIVSNQEDNHTIVIISYPSGQVLWQYGHPLKAGSAPGYLDMPDDAYVLKDGEVTVADDGNCRILFLNPDKTIAGQIGTTGSCNHQPPTGVAKPNGDTPLADGNYLVSEIQGQWISEYTKSGQLAWSTHLPIHYPSDPQQLGPNLYLLCDYAQSPGGAIDEFNQQGQILYRLQPTQGILRMNQPSLAELLPSGVFMANDDYRDRMVAYDPPTGALVWQYGVADSPGTAPGYLNIPDGFDLLAPDGSTPTHTATG